MLQRWRAHGRHAVRRARPVERRRDLHRRRRRTASSASRREQRRLRHRPASKRSSSPAGTHARLRRLWRTAWCSTSGRPKVLRWRAQASASSKQTAAKAQALVAISRRSPLKLSMMARKPSFSSPIRFSAGTRQPVNASRAVSLHHQPILASGERSRPGRRPAPRAARYRARRGRRCGRRPSASRRARPR